jgi:hypothetical protein
MKNFGDIKMHGATIKTAMNVDGILFHTQELNNSTLYVLTAFHFDWH